VSLPPLPHPKLPCFKKTFELLLVKTKEHCRSYSQNIVFKEIYKGTKKPEFYADLKNIGIGAKN